MKSWILVACLLASGLSARAAVATNSPAAVTHAPPATPEPVAASVSSLKLKGAGNSQSRITSAATGVVAPTNAYPLHIVTCHEDVDVDALLAEHQVQLQNPKHKLANLKMFFVPPDAALIQRLKADPRVIAVEADGPVSLCDQYIPDGLKRMGIPQFPPAHINGVTEPIDVDVAILDSGIGPHEDLNVFTNFSVYAENAYDMDGHGTAVAGVLGALDNGFGVVGVAPGVRIWNVQVTSPAGGSWSDVVSGIGFVLQHASRISMASFSLANNSTNAPISALRTAVRNLVRAGVVVVAAAGQGPNDGVSVGWDLAGPDQVYGTGDDALPASSPHAMAVSAMDASIYAQGGQPLDQLASFSNFSQVERPNDVTAAYRTNYVVSPGRSIDVAASGVNVVTTAISNSYGFRTGTSFAAPHVAGLVALYIAANGRATNEWGVYRIRQAIVDNALPQSQWHTNNTLDPDTNPEPLAIASEAWIPKPVITNTAGAPGNFSVGFNTVPGYDYTVQSTTNLTAPIPWENLRTFSGSSNVVLASVTDTNVAAQSFYRLARLATVEPPIIISQPQSWEMPSGGAVKLRVAVLGSAMIGLLWHKDGVPMTDGGNISGATSPSLVLTNVQLPDAGAYTVVITNAYGSATSAVATVTILTNLTSSPVTGVLATATSEYSSLGRFASNAVNGVYNDPNFWGSAADDLNPAITFDLGAVRPLEKTVVWNGHELDPSVKRMSIAVSSDGVGFNSLGSFTLTTQSPTSEIVTLGGVVCRYVRFTIRENGAGQTFPAGAASPSNLVAIDEVEFHEYQGD